MCAGAFAVGSLALLYTFQDRMLYLPGAPIRHIKDNPPGYRSPEERRIKYETIELHVPDCPEDVIKGWLMTHSDSLHDTLLFPDGKLRKTVVFFHENAGNLGLRLDYFSMLYNEMGLNVISFAYRGYSDSILQAGFPSESSIKQDAHIIMAYLASYKQQTGAPVFAVGRSLGGAVAAYAALIEPDVFDGLILENTFTSIADMVDSLFYFVGYFKPLILRIKWDTRQIVSQLQLPILFVTGTNDEIVPPGQTMVLADAAKKSVFKNVMTVLSGRHNDTWRLTLDQYKENLGSFMRDALSFAGNLCLLKEQSE